MVINGDIRCNIGRCRVFNDAGVPYHIFCFDRGLWGPVFAFEAARTSQELIDVFGPTDDPERAIRISMMDAGNKWDFGFMLVYAVFMAVFMAAFFMQLSLPQKADSI